MRFITDIAQHKKAAAVTAGLALTFALFPATAFAVPMNITQTAESGENPSSTIIITDENDTEIGRYDYAGGDATVKLPDDITNKIEVGGTYYVTATADGYAFNTQGGEIQSEDGASVSLVARRAVDVIVQLDAGDGTDYSGIQAELYEGSSASGEPVSQVSTDASGRITFQNIPAGTYTLKLSLPDSLDGVLPVTQSITVPDDPTENVNVTVTGTQPEDDATAAESEETETAQEPADATVIDEDEITQTGANSGVIIAGAAVGVGAIAGGVAIWRRNKK